MKMEPEKSFIPGKSLRGLSYALRHPETWPQGFEWKFVNCNRCAMGLAVELMMVDRPTPGAMIAAFGIPEREAVEIFCMGNLFVAITATDVADRIDEYLAKLEKI